MARVYLRELQDQLALVKSKLSEIHVPRGPLARPLKPEVQERRQHLLKRKRDLEQKIIDYQD